MLLSHWNENGRSGWSMPGGGIDPGEDPADAAVREIKLFVENDTDEYGPLVDEWIAENQDWVDTLTD